MKAIELQRLILSSNGARLLAVRKVTQENQGKKTAGIDGVHSLTPKQRTKMAHKLQLEVRALPVRRVWIPKPGKEEKRPLGIPTMEDRARQAITLFALEPMWEAKFEPNSYGFRPGRSTWDATEAIFSALKDPIFIYLHQIPFSSKVNMEIRFSIVYQALRDSNRNLSVH